MKRNSFTPHLFVLCFNEKKVKAMRTHRSISVIKQMVQIGAGFTLTELLVVISIIALLLAIMFPLFQKSREEVKSISCRSNIKQLSLSLSNYVEENGTFPYSFYNSSLMKISPPGGYAGKSEYDRTGWWWLNLVKGVYNRTDERNTIVKCPSKLLYNYKLNQDILCGNYGVNRSVCKSSDDRQSRRDEFIGKPLKGTEIPKPAQTLLIADSGYAMVSWWYAAVEPPVTLDDSPIEDTAYIPGLSININKNKNKNRKLMPGQEQDAINGRHPNRTVNIGFTDGHISLTKAEDLLVEKTGESYKNKIPLWVPK